jgi:predicted permease
MHPLLRFALVLCPREFRRHHAAEIAHDINSHSNATIRLALDLAIHGIVMRCEEIGRNLKFALRTLRKAPLFTAISVLAIALAIGPNVAVVSIVNAVFLKPLPFAHADRIAFVSETGAGTDFSYPDALDVFAQSQSFENVGVSVIDSATLTGHGQPVVMNGSIVNDGYFATLGISPALGRFFTPADRGSHSVIISDRLRRLYFASRPTVIGSTIVLDGVSKVIIGVAPAQFRDPVQNDLYSGDYWVPIDPRSPTAARGYRAYDTWARLRPGVSVAAARADVERVLTALARRKLAGGPELSGPLPLHATVQQILPTIVGPVGAMLVLLYLGVSALLLIACANLANLALLRIAAREREVVVRSAMGATRAHLASQFCTEVGFLAAAGGVLGIALGWWALRLFSGLAAQMLPRWEDVRIGLPVIAYVAALLVGTTIVMGLLPALLQRRDLARLLNAGRSGTLRSRKAGRMRAALVVAEVALAIAVVTSSGLVARSFFLLTHVPIGFDSQNVSIVSGLNFPGSRYATLGSRALAAARVLSAIKRTPGVIYAAAAQTVPFDGSDYNVRADIPQRHLTRVRAEIDSVSPDYFSALRIPILRGRAFSDTDRATSRPVALVNAAFARQYFGTLDIVGQSIAPHVVRTGSSPSGLARTIVGVVTNTRDAFAQAPRAEMYFPQAQVFGQGELVIRARLSPGELAAAVTSAVARLDPLLPVPAARPYTALLDQDSSAAEAAAILFGMLGFIALGLALGGTYVVAADSTTQRRREFGIRKALGARSAAVLSDVLLASFLQSAVGAVVGLVAVAGFSQLLASLLFQTSPFDPLTFASVVTLVVACTTAASLTPALRATHADPAVALRYE